MLLNIIERDASKNTTRRRYDLGFLPFLKSIGTTGNANPSSIRAWMKSFGYLFYFWEYFDEHPLYHLRFKRPPMALVDPTAISQFSNITGRAIADRLARDLSGALFTHTYEAALMVRNITHTGQRPDLFCDTGVQQFTIEAKGLSCESGSDNAMEQHKEQASSGPIPVHFSIASVSYNLFREPTCKYYDPVLDGAEYQADFNQNLARFRLASILSDLERFQSTRVSDKQTSEFERFIIDDDPELRVVFLVNKRIRQFINERKMPFPKFEKISNEGFFVDRDGLGIELGY